jgi:hypothetical protein
MARFERSASAKHKAWKQKDYEEEEEEEEEEEKKYID